MIGQQYLPSQAPYTLLDYGTTVMTLIVLGIVLWFVFRTLRQILNDHAQAMTSLVEAVRIMKEELFTLVTDVRHVHETLLAQQRTDEIERAVKLSKEYEELRRYVKEEDHRTEATRHVKGDES